MGAGRGGLCFGHTLAMLDQQSDAHRTGMPAAGDQPAEWARPRGVLIDMEPLRIELFRKSLDFLARELVASKLGLLADAEIFEIPAHGLGSPFWVVFRLSNI